MKQLKAILITLIIVEMLNNLVGRVCMLPGIAVLSVWVVGYKVFTNKKLISSEK